MIEDIDADDFKATILECAEQLKRVDAQLSDLPAKSDGIKSIEDLLDCLVTKYLAYGHTTNMPL